MDNLSDNNVIKFINISRKKTGLFANFKAKGIRGGVLFTASISVDLDSVDVDLTDDSLDTIIDTSAKAALREFKKADLQVEGPALAMSV